MALLFGTLRGRQALAWLKHRRHVQFKRLAPGPQDTRVDSDANGRVTSDAVVRVTQLTSPL
jgi:hypothetical protein